MKKIQKALAKKPHISNRDMQFWFCAISLSGFAITVVVLFISHGDLFPKIFYKDIYDTGMDFFHSIEYVRGRSPYELFHTLYPPLANLFFYLLYRFVPLSQSSQWADTFSGGIEARRTSIDLRVWQPTLMLFIGFIALTAIALVFLVPNILGRSAKSEMVGLCMVLSYGVIKTYERGNIVIIAVLCCMFFVAYKDSANPYLKELALIALAIGFGLKIYPAVFGILLIYEKEYFKAARTVLYGLIAFIAPLFVFHGGISNLSFVINKLLAYGGPSTSSSSGYSFDKILTSIVLMLQSIWHFEIAEVPWITFTTWANKILFIALLLRGFFLRKKWQKVLICTLSLLVYQNQAMYVVTFMLIPLVFMLKEEKTICKSNFIPFIGLVFMCILLPIYDMNNAIISFISLRMQICMLALIIWVFMTKETTSGKLTHFFQMKNVKTTKVGGEH